MNGRRYTREYYLEEVSQTLVGLANLMKMPSAKTYLSKTKKELKKETTSRKIPTDNFSRDMLMLEPQSKGRR